MQGLAVLPLVGRHSDIGLFEVVSTTQMDKSLNRLWHGLENLERFLTSMSHHVSRFV